MNIMRKLLPVLIIASAAPSAMAATTDDSFQVTLEIEAACSLTASDLDFGVNSGSISANIDATTSLTANCTNGAVYSIGLNNGLGIGATAGSRKMTNSADGSVVNYSLYTDAGRANVWDNNCSVLPGVEVTCVNGTGNGAGQTITVYGRVPSGQSNVTVGSYVDTIVATLTF